MKAATTVHFNDNSHITFTYKRDQDAHATARTIHESMDNKIVSVEANGEMFIIPAYNIKYVHVTPAPAKFPGPIIRGATIH